jgi:FKBP-type peptidyl-prolyl cis-trans isomerase
MTKNLLFVLFISGSTFCSAQTTGVTTPKTSIKSRLDSASYAIGLGVAQDLKSRGIAELNYVALTEAMKAVFKGSTPTITLEQGQKAIYEFLSEANKAKYATSIAEGAKFLAENKAKPGVVTLPSGVQYVILKNATGPKPKASDEVTVHYKGTLLNGKQFDSSYDRNEPITLELDKVIPGWTEGVQQMPVGSKFKFFIPYKSGYGEQGAGENIPPYSTLIFEIELLKITPPAATNK